MQNEVSTNEPVIVKTDVGTKDGQNKCPLCGSTDIETNINTGKLRCNFCRHEFDPEKLVGMIDDISQLQGEVMASGATDIIADTKDVLTFKCSSCGAEVVIDTASALQARCHWCRNTLSVNEQIPNGSVPDVVLPFGINKDIARAEIEKFVGARKFFAHPQFRKEFTTNNIMGVYFPYMLVDVNSHVDLKGQGEHEVRRYIIRNGDSTETRYDADLYQVERSFDFTISGLSIESSSERLNTSSSSQTNNIINAIMPFDVENCVKYNANYLKGYTSEKRDTNIGDLKDIVGTQSKDIAVFAANKSVEFYDRGVNWTTKDMNIKGEQWKAAYLPVWLYSYLQVKGEKKLLHYVAVNARTKEVMGSVPINMGRLLLVSGIIEFFGILGVIFVDWNYRWIFLLLGFIYYGIMYSRYRNKGARHTYETETKSNITNMVPVDTFIKRERGLSSSTMHGANNRQITTIFSKFNKKEEK